MKSDITNPVSEDMMKIGLPRFFGVTIVSGDVTGLISAIDSANGTTGETHNPTVASNGWIVYEYDGLLYAIDSNNCATPCTPTAALVTGHPSSVHKFPAFSPDGNQLAVSISDDLFTMNFSAGSVSGVTELTNANSAAIDTHPAWSPADTSLMFESDRDGDRSLYTYEIGTATASTVELVSNDVVMFSEPLMMGEMAIENVAHAGDGDIVNTTVQCSPSPTQSVQVSVTDANALLAAIDTASSDVITIIYLAPGDYSLPYRDAESLFEIDKHIMILGTGIDPNENPDSPANPLTTAILKPSIQNASYDLFQITNCGNLTLYNIVIEKWGGTNKEFGGAIRNNGGYLRIVQSRLKGNIASEGGGSIHTYNGGMTTIFKSLLQGNYSPYGAAIFVNGESNLNIECTTFQDNTQAQALVQGSAIYHTDLNTSTTIWKSNFITSEGIQESTYIYNSTPIIDAPYNWWGDNSLPNGPQTLHGVNAYPWLESKVNTVSCPTPNDIVPLLPEPQSKLEAYGIRLVNDGNYQWDEQIVLAAVETTAQAFYLLRESKGTLYEAFRTVMIVGDNPDYIEFVYVDPLDTESIYNDENGDYYINVGGCKAIQGSNDATNPQPRRIVCKQSGGHHSEYALIHELGHLFDNRSIRTLFGVIEQSGKGCTNAQEYCIFDNDFTVVMGKIRDNHGNEYWARGERGWGSGPSDVFTPFQQHPPNFSLFLNEGVSIKMDETAADMFLNWVYRRNTDNPPKWMTVEEVESECEGPQEMGDWQGFRNINGDGSFGNTNNAEPGNVRYWWLEQKLDAIFTQHVNWTH